MKKIPWYLLISVALLLMTIAFFINYVLNAAPIFHLKNESNVELGISVVQQDISTILNQSESNSPPRDEKTISFLLQSPIPTAQIYLDYVAIYGKNNDASTICFKSISIPKSEKVPFEIVAVLGNLIISSEEFRYDFPENNHERCLGKGAQKIMPHILLGVVPINIGFDSFPFDQQIFELNMMVNTDELGMVSPSIRAVVAQAGWVGDFDTNKAETPTLRLHRHLFIQFMLLLFIVIMIPIIPLLNSVIDEPASFFEVAFSILLGLWGLHTIFIPDYIRSSVVVDAVFYVLYIMVLFTILRELLRISVLNLIKRSVRIVHVEYDPPGNDLDGEYVEITNESLLPVDMTNWHLLDKAKNKFTFPLFTLRKKSSVKIWTKDGQNDQTNLYWGSKKPIWNNDEDVAYLEDDKFVNMQSYSYTKK